MSKGKLRLRVHRGARAWAPPPAVFRAIAARLSRPARIEIVPRSKLAAVWARDHGGRALDVPAYAFRAYSSNGRAVLFVDGTETPGSVLWLMLHELAHLELPASDLLLRGLRSVPKPAKYLVEDAAHESHPEEKLANLIATQTLAELGLPAVALDRVWWRQRVRKLAATA